MSTPEKERAELARARADRAEIQLAAAHTTGRIAQVYDNLRDDPEHVELMRCLAWTRTGQTPFLKDGRPTGAPAGWPDGVDADTFVGEWIDGRVARHAARVELGANLEEPVTAAVKKFRELLSRPEHVSD